MPHSGEVTHLKTCLVSVKFGITKPYQVNSKLFLKFYKTEFNKDQGIHFES